MKTKTNLFLSLFLLLGVMACSQEFKKVPDEDVNATRELFARRFATDILTRLSEGSYYEFKDEATEAMKNLLTESSQKAVYQQVRSELGDFRTLEYVETWQPSSQPEMQIYRYRCSFSESDKQAEARVVLDGSGKIAGFFIKPWSDMLQ